VSNPDLYREAARLAFYDLETWAVISGALCVWLTVRQNVWCWPTAILSAAIYVPVLYRVSLYPDMDLQVAYVILSLYGWYHWLWPQGKRQELPVTRVSLREAVLLAVACAVAAPLTGFLFARYTQSALPWWDSLIMVTSLIAQWMMTRKLLENWHLWIVTDIILIGIYGYQGLYPTASLYVAYTVLAVSGLLEWRRSMATAG
jgi:nicotinamide mononucleotide transporter